MSCSNNNIESLIARRPRALNHAFLDEVLGSRGNGLTVKGGRDDSAGATAFEALRNDIRDAMDEATDGEDRPAEARNGPPSMAVDPLWVAYENVAAAEAAAGDVSFARATSELTRSRILAAFLPAPQHRLTPWALGPELQ